MSHEKRKDTKEEKKRKSLKESPFRRTDFTPLNGVEIKKVISEIKPVKKVIEEELTEIEKDVLDIAKEILKLKRFDAEFEIESAAQIQKYPIIEKLYAKCISKLSYKKGYSKGDIFLAIRSLEEKNWIVTNERRTKVEILENEKLMNILNFINENPGIHARDEKIEITLNLTRTPFLKHIMTLERFNLIRSKRFGKSLHYFGAEIPEIDKLDKFKVIFLNPLIPRIIEEIFKDETIPISKIGDNLEIYSGTIQYHVKKLKQLELLKMTKNRSGKKIHLVNTELLKKYNEIFKDPDFSKLLQRF
ncbi:MAG: winged helix-turn-helix transcriptional regulator [Promethearchaeota archaeon]